MTILTGFKLPEPLAPGSAPWLAKWSASQIAAACGLSEWDTRRSLYDAKAGITPPKKTTDVMDRGHEFEPIIRNWVAEANPNWMVEDGTDTTWQHAIRDWQIATPDGLIHHEDGTIEILEVKTSQNLHEWDDLLLTYKVQGMWLMDTIGARRVHFAVCGPFELFSRRPKMYTLDYNPAEAAALREKALELDTEIKLGIQPPADHTKECDRLAVRYAHTGFVDDPGLEIPDELAVPYLEAFAAAADAEVQKKATASKLLEYMRSQKKATYRGVTIANRVNGKGDNPPSLRATNGLADKAPELLTERKAAA